MDEPSFKIQIYYSFTIGANVDLCSPHNTEENLASQATEIARVYAQMLSVVFGPTTDSPGTKRIQYAFAAGCAGYNPKEWEDLSEEEKEYERQRFCRMYQPSQTSLDRTPPTIVIYLAGKRTITASPSYELTQSDTMHRSEKYEVWDPMWENAKTSADLPCTWGWHVHENQAYNSARLIFISGVFAIWPIFWQRRGLPLSEASRRMCTLNAFLQVVLFHELVHATRSITLDMPKLTLPKCIDPRNQRVTADGLQGEAGRLAEGLVLGLYMADLKIQIFATDEDEERTPYEVPFELCTQLFMSEIPLPPLSIQILKQILIPLHYIPPEERFKSNAFHEEATVQVKSQPQNRTSYTFPIAKNRLVAIPRPLADKIAAQEAARGSCVEFG